jgi:hypothetical protein
VKYKLIAADMDGTLLNDESELSERTKTAILGAVKAGALFVAATGRAMPGVENVNALFDKDTPFIILNGASAVMGKSRKVLLEKHLDITLAKEVYDIGMSRDIPMVLWTAKQLWISRDYKETSDYRNMYAADMKIISDIDELKDEGIFKILWFETPANVRRLQHEMNDHFQGRLNCPEIGRVFGIGRSEMVAVGDGYNDISMLKYAGLGIAMENSPDDVKAVCSEVTLSNNNDGVAAVIERYIL